MIIPIIYTMTKYIFKYKTSKTTFTIKKNTMALIVIKEVNTEIKTTVNITKEENK